MGNVSRGRKSDAKFWGAVDSAVVIEKGDLLYYDSNDVKPASSQADQGSEGDNQALFASKFAGVSEDRSDSGDTDDILVDANPLRDWEFPCASATYEVGDLLGVNEASGGTSLEDQELAKVNCFDSAIMICTRREASATTSIRCRILPGRGGAHNPRPRANIRTLTGATTLTLDDTPIQTIDPDGANDLILPPEAAAAGRFFFLKNAAGGAEDITVKNDAAGTVGTISQGEVGIAFCDGTTWHLMVAAST